MDDGQEDRDRIRSFFVWSAAPRDPLPDPDRLRELSELVQRLVEDSGGVLVTWSSPVGPDPFWYFHNAEDSQW